MDLGDESGEVREVVLPDADRARLKRGAKIVVFLALLTDFVLLTMPLPIMPHELACTIERPAPDCVSDSLIFVLFASKALLQILANPFMGSAVDRNGPMGPLRLSLVVMAISTGGFAYGLWLNQSEDHPSTTDVIFPILLASRAVQGLSSGGVMTGGMALVNMAHPESERGAAAGEVMAGMALGVLSGPVIGGGLTKVWSSWGAFLVVAFLVVCGAFAQATLLRGAAQMLEALQNEQAEVEQPQETASFLSKSAGSFVGSISAKAGVAAVMEVDKGQDGKHPRATISTASYNVYRDPLVLTVALCTLVTSTSIALLEPLVPLYLHRPPFNMDPFMQSLVWSASTLAYMVSTPLAGILADKCPEWSLLLMGLLLMAVGALTVVSTGELWSTIVALLFVGSAMGFIDTPASPLLAKIADFRRSFAYGRVFAVMDMATSLGFVIGPLAGAAVESQGLSFTSTTVPVAIVCVLVAPLTLILRGLPSAEVGSVPKASGAVEMRVSGPGDVDADS